MDGIDYFQSRLSLLHALGIPFFCPPPSHVMTILVLRNNPSKPAMLTENRPVFLRRLEKPAKAPRLAYLAIRANNNLVVFSESD